MAFGEIWVTANPGPSAASGAGSEILGDGASEVAGAAAAQTGDSFHRPDPHADDDLFELIKMVLLRVAERATEGAELKRFLARLTGQNTGLSFVNLGLKDKLTLNLGAHMDAISPGYRFDMSVDSTWQMGEWSFDPEHWLMFHVPTQALFAVQLAEGKAELPDLRARLVHVCGSALPDNLALLAQKAMNAFATFSDGVMSWSDEKIPF